MNPLTVAERQHLDQYLSDPISFPLPFKQWIDTKTSDGIAAVVPTIRNNTAGAGASVAAGAATVNVTHGLGVAPLRVYLSPTADTQGLRWWVSAKGASTFTITLSGNATTNPVTFDWKAEF